MIGVLCACSSLFARMMFSVVLVAPGSIRMAAGGAPSSIARSVRSSASSQGNGLPVVGALSP